MSSLKERLSPSLYSDPMVIWVWHLYCECTPLFGVPTTLYDPCQANLPVGQVLTPFQPSGVLLRATGCRIIHGGSPERLLHQRGPCQYPLLSSCGSSPCQWCPPLVFSLVDAAHASVSGHGPNGADTAAHCVGVRLGPRRAPADMFSFFSHNCSNFTGME